MLLIKILNKKAIELSVNFIVILIISIIIFGFGIKFIYDLSSQAADIQKMTIKELDGKISNIICEGAERVCIGTDRKTIQRGKIDFFGLKITNILEPAASANGQYFEIAVFPPSDSLGIKKDKSPIPRTEPHLIINPPEARSIFIPQNEEQEMGIGIQVPPKAVSGTYILNVEIKTDIKQQDDTYQSEPYSTIQKLYVEVP